MMTWNYRVFKEKSGEYIIREVYYDADGSIIACTQDAVEPLGESLKELAKDIEYFKEALTLPILTPSDIPQPKEYKRKRDHRKNMSREQLEEELGIAKPPVARRAPRQPSHTKRVLVASSKKRG
jgi:hypothetical protein